MKFIQHLAVAGLLAAALGQSASAIDHVYVTGSTAFRTAAINAIAAAVGLPNTGSSGGNGFGGGTGNDTSITGTGKTSYIWEGGTDPSTGNPVTVCATFTGSASGVGIVTTSTAIPFLSDGSTGTSNPSAYNDANGTTPHAGYPTVIPDFTFSDVYQTTTPFNSNTGYNTLPNDNQVGIVTFKWMGSKNFPLGAGVATSTTLPSSYSMEPNVIQEMFATGLAPMAMLSNNPSDEHVELFAVGRNPDSGTRLTAFADGVYGVSRVVKQWSPVISSGAVTSHSLYPIQTIYGLVGTTALGNSGEATGANLRAFLQVTLPTSGLWTAENANGTVSTTQPAGVTAAYYVTYLGISDAASVEGSSTNLTGAVELAYKGCNYSTQAIQQGQYTFWSYEHVMDRGDLGDGSTTGGGAAGTFAAFDVESNMISTIQGWTSTNTNISGSGLQNDTNMKVKRSGDGLLVKPKYVF